MIREQLASLLFGSIPWRHFLDREGWDAYYDFHALRARLGPAIVLPHCDSEDECLQAAKGTVARLANVGRLRDMGVEPNGVELIILRVTRRYLTAVLAARKRFTHWLQEAE